MDAGIKVFNIPFGELFFGIFGKQNTAVKGKFITRVLRLKGADKLVFIHLHIYTAVLRIVRKSLTLGSYMHDLLGYVHFQNGAHRNAHCVQTVYDEIENNQCGRNKTPHIG